MIAKGNAALILSKALYKIKDAFADVQKTQFFTGHPPVEEANAFKPKAIIKSKVRMYVVDSGTSLHMMGDTSLSSQKKTIRQTKLTWRSKPRQAWSVLYIQESGTCLYVMLVEDSSSVKTLGRLCE